MEGRVGRGQGMQDQRPGSAQVHTVPIAQLLLTAFPCSPNPPLASLGKPSQVASLPGSGHQVILFTSQNLPGKLPTPVVLP